MEPISEQIDVIRTMDEMRTNGASYRQIADHLNSNQIAPPGKWKFSGLEKWHAATVRKILVDDYYRPRAIPDGLTGFDAVRAQYIVGITSVLGDRSGD